MTRAATVGCFSRSPRNVAAIERQDDAVGEADRGRAVGRALDERGLAEEVPFAEDGQAAVGHRDPLEQAHASVVHEKGLQCGGTLLEDRLARREATPVPTE